MVIIVMTTRRLAKLRTLPTDNDSHFLSSEGENGIISSLEKSNNGLKSEIKEARLYLS